MSASRDGRPAARISAGVVALGLLAGGGRAAACTLLLATLFAGVPEAAWAGAQTFNTALPVAQGEGVFRGQFIAVRRSGDPTSADRDLAVLSGVSVLGYGVTGDLTLFGILPYLHKELERTTPAGARIERDTSGIGDLRMFARYTAFHDDAPGRTFRIAPFAGVKTPTGDDDERDRFGRLPQSLQLGSGSWDPFFGVVGTWQTLAYEVDAQLAYEINTEANDFEFGDVFRADASFQHRLWPRQLGPGVPGFFYGVIEANLIHRDENEVDGVADPDSGGTTLFLSPRVQYVTRRWVLEGVVQVPAFQDLDGGALEDDWTVRAGFRFNL